MTDYLLALGGNVPPSGEMCWRSQAAAVLPNELSVSWQDGAGLVTLLPVRPFILPVWRKGRLLVLCANSKSAV